MAWIERPDRSVDCKWIAYVSFWPVVQGVCDPCQRYFMMPSRMVWRISTGVSTAGSKPGKLLEDQRPVSERNSPSNVKKGLYIAFLFSCTQASSSVWIWAEVDSVFLRSDRERAMRSSIQNWVYASLIPCSVCWFWTFWATPRQASSSWYFTSECILSVERGTPG